MPVKVESPPLKRRARVYKNGLYWTWYHPCSLHALKAGAVHGVHETALHFALKHVRDCR
jgi:hypothetical protein